MYKKICIVTKGGIFYSDKYETVYDALDDSQLYYMIGPKRKYNNTMDIQIITGVSGKFVNQQKIKDDTFIKESFSTKWGIRKVSDEELKKLKILKLVNEKTEEAKHAANLSRWWWTEPSTGNSYYVYSCFMFDVLAKIDMAFDHEF